MIHYRYVVARGARRAKLDVLAAAATHAHTSPRRRVLLTAAFFCKGDGERHNVRPGFFSTVHDENGAVVDENHRFADVALAAEELALSGAGWTDANLAI